MGCSWRCRRFLPFVESHATIAPMSSTLTSVIRPAMRRFCWAVGSKLPVMLTLRGKEERQARTSVAVALKRAITGADQLITVSAALQALAIEQGANPARVQVIGNGVDLSRFIAVPREDARRQFGLPADAEVLISVGTLVERKGFHRVIECLPGLLAVHPTLHLMVVGGAGPEGDMSGEAQAHGAHAADSTIEFTFSARSRTTV